MPAQRHAAVDGLVRAEVAPRRPAAGAGRARGPDGEFHSRVGICAAAGDGAPADDVPLDGPDARRGRRRPPADLDDALAGIALDVLGQLRLHPQRRPRQELGRCV